MPSFALNFVLPMIRLAAIGVLCYNLSKCQEQEDKCYASIVSEHNDYGFGHVRE